MSIVYFLSTACSEQSNDLETSINGTWNLISIQGGFSDALVYETGDITWEFNDKTIIIKNTIDANTGPDFVNGASGNYTYEILQESNNEILSVDNRKGVIMLTGNTLTIDYGIALDDILLTFKR